MKKKVKRLMLSKETVRSLEDLTLDKVAGGTGGCYGTNGYCNTEPGYSCQNSCQIYCLEEPLTGG